MRWFGLNDEKGAPIVFTTWSIVHTVAGLVMMLLFLYAMQRWYPGSPINTIAMLLKGLAAVNFVHALYETKDLVQSETTNPPYTVSWQNSLGDQTCATLGAIGGYLLANSMSPAGLIDTTIGATVLVNVVSSAFWMYG